MGQPLSLRRTTTRRRYARLSARRRMRRLHTVLRELKAESEPEALATALTATGFAFARIGLEAGPVSQWLL